MNEKDLQELLPILESLTRQYTSCESTSVTYETANQLMEAILYCIQEYENYNSDKNQLCGDTTIERKQQFLIGQDLVYEKVCSVKNRYNRLTADFESYGNRNYQDTVQKAIPGFFLYYDPKFHPQRDLITYDYPTIVPVVNQKKTRIDRMEKYIDYLEIEQNFLRRFTKEYVIQILEKFDPDYKRQYYNIAAIMIRHLMARFLIEKSIEQNCVEGDYEKLYQLIDCVSAKELQSLLENTLKGLLSYIGENSSEVYSYFVYDCNAFAIELKNVQQVCYIKNVVVL